MRIIPLGSHSIRSKSVEEWIQQGSNLKRQGRSGWGHHCWTRPSRIMSPMLNEPVLDETGNDSSIRMNLNLLEQTVQSFLWSRSLNKEQKHLDMTLVFGKHILTIIPILPENFNKNFLLGNDFSIWMNLLEQTAQLVLWSRSWNEDFQALVSLNFSCTGHQFWTARKSCEVSCSLNVNKVSWIL